MESNHQKPGFSVVDIGNVDYEPKKEKTRCTMNRCYITVLHIIVVSLLFVVMVKEDYCGHQLELVKERNSVSAVFYKEMVGQARRRNGNGRKREVNKCADSFSAIFFQGVMKGDTPRVKKSVKGDVQKNRNSVSAVALHETGGLGGETHRLEQKVIDTKNTKSVSTALLRKTVKESRRLKREVSVNNNNTSTTKKPNKVLIEAKAVHVVFNAPELHIKREGETLGPLFLSKDGKEFGFDKKWNKDMKLGNNNYAVQIQYEGLYLVIAQIKYVANEHNTDNHPVGFRIYSRKKSSATRVPFILAECVLPPLRSPASCCVSTSAELQHGDEVSIVHISPSALMIDTDAAASFLNILNVPPSLAPS